MAQTVLQFNRRSDPVRAEEAQKGRRLGAEKLGVIGGFLIGLPIGVGLVGEALSSVGSPTWLTVLLGALVVAFFTRLGQSLAMAMTDSDEA